MGWIYEEVGVRKNMIKIYEKQVKHSWRSKHLRSLGGLYIYFILYSYYLKAWDLKIESLASMKDIVSDAFSSSAKEADGNLEIVV